MNHCVMMAIDGSIYYGSHTGLYVLCLSFRALYVVTVRQGCVLW